MWGREHLEAGELGAQKITALRTAFHLQPLAVTRAVIRHETEATRSPLDSFKKSTFFMSFYKKGR